MNRRGFTMVETLVAIAIAGVVLGALATAVRSQSQTTIFQLGAADMQQDVRVALDIFSREMRMAGFGMAAVPEDALAPVVVEAPGAGIVSSVLLRGNYGNVRSQGSAAASTITLDAAAAPFPTFVAGKKVAITSAIFGVAEARTIASYNAATHVISLTADLARAYDSGSLVNQIDEIRYQLDGQGVLRRNAAGTNDPVADQLTGGGALQLAYVLADGTTVADPSGNIATLRSSTMSLHGTRSTHVGLTPQATFGTEVRIRNLGITAAISEGA